MKPEGTLTDNIVHQQDVRRAIGVPRTVAPDRLRVALDATKDVTNSLLPGKKRIAGISLRATDMDWSAGTPGVPEVAGPGEALLLAMAGRRRGARRPVGSRRRHPPRSDHGLTAHWPEPRAAGEPGQAVISWMASVSAWLPPGPPPCWAIMSLVMSPWTLTLPAMKACIPACWLPETKTSLAVA